MIKILIVDDHDLVREGIRAILEKEPSFAVVGEAGEGKEAIEAVRRASPDVVLMDVSLPGGLGGLEAAEAILAEHPDVKIIVLTQYENREYVKRAMRIGARGYLLKRSVSEQLLTAIRTVHRGERYLHPAAAGELVDMLASGEGLERDEIEQLTTRERQVFKLLAEGRTSREIAKYLTISLKTAMTHRANLMAKLGLHSRTELIKHAIRKGVIQVERE
jgi:two-component system, NarL family, response regulator NreC